MTARIAIALGLVVVTQVLVACGTQVDTSGPLPPPKAGAGPVRMPPVDGGSGESMLEQPMAVIPTSGTGPLAPEGDASTPDAGSPAQTFLPLPESTACVVGCTAAIPPLSRELVQADPVPPALGGGGMLVSRDGKQLIVADADRDRLYFVDVETHTLAHVRELQAGDQPGRMVEDAAGRIHVALRGGAALLTLGRAPDAPLTRRALCALPRGVAYDAARDVLQLACAEGQLVTAPADPSGAVIRKVDLGRDLRDVIVRGDGLLVTRFRSAELLRVDANGVLKERLLPPLAQVTNLRDPQTNAALPATSNSPDMLWRALDLPGKGSALLHQRARDGQVAVKTGGYGSMGCSGLVQTSLTVGLDGMRAVSVDLSDSAVSIDMAVDPSGALLAVISPGNWGSMDQLRVYSLTGASALNPQAPAGLLVTPASASSVFGPIPVAGSNDVRCVAPGTRYPTPEGQLSAVAWAQGVYGLELAAFEREPAAISFIHARTGRGLARVDLGQASRYDTGHAFFHARTVAGLACASCHGEAGDDGHVWTFENEGARRTQSLRGGIAGTEPLHWGGDMKDFGALVSEVFVRRMQGPELNLDQGAALQRFIDRQPGLSAPPRDMAQAQRGRALFQSAAVGCASCHAGALLTDNRSQDVGTGAVLQVPALRSVSFRLPLMHNGCATSLRQRFDAACGGGDTHGHTSQLAATDLDDLVAYLETL